MNAAAAGYNAYLARINRVFDYIDAHLAEPLDLDALSKVAHFSPYHFHRIFKALAGETLAERVRRRRVEVAAARLLGMHGATASAIALDVGFASPEVFTRAFRGYFGMTPTQWRGGGYQGWKDARQAVLSKFRQDESKKHQAVLEAIRNDGGMWPHGHIPANGDLPMHVEIKTLHDARVAYMRHVGPYGSAGISQMWQRFAMWCRDQGLIPPPRLMYGVCMDDPGVTPADKLRYDACIEIADDFKPQGEIGVTTLKGGRYACASFAGTAAQISAAWGRFLSDWLPGSGYAVDTSDEARRALELYGMDFKMDKDTGVFNCLLCLPVRAAS